MTHRRCSKLRLLAFASLTALTGCNSSTAPQLGEVNGKVTLDGAPLAGVHVTFYPDTELTESPPFSRGTTDAAGVYQLALATSDGKSGAVVGKHRIVVNWPLEDRSNPQRGRDAKARPSVPLPYTIASETPLRAEVKAGGPQTIDLPLKSFAPP